MTGSAVLSPSRGKEMVGRLGQVIPWAAMPMARADSGRVARLPRLPIQGALSLRCLRLGQRKLGELLIPRHRLCILLGECCSKSQSRGSFGASMSRAAATLCLACLLGGSLAGSSSGQRGASMSATVSGFETASGHWKGCFLKRMRMPTMNSLRRFSGSP